MARTARSQRCRPVLTLVSLCLGCMILNQAAASDSRSPIVSDDVVFEERGGLVAVEAEHFSRSRMNEKRAFHIVSTEQAAAADSDGDPPHLAGTAGGAYVEVLPDSRRTHDDRLVAGENFSNQPGKMAVLSYRVHFSTPGRYYVWVRAFSSGPEDNSLHVGLDGSWPESGQRMQWCEGKNSWRWESKQRTEKEHCGVPHQIFLDVATPGLHDVEFSMREDGFEFDRWLMTTSRDFPRPDGIGPASVVHAGTVPPPFSSVAVAAPAIATVATQASQQTPALQLPRNPDGDGSIEIDGELKQWHKVTLTLDSSFAHELDREPNPFTDHRFDVEFTHESGAPKYRVPGYFAADGKAAETAASSGTKWRAHLSPDKIGRWNYKISMMRGPGIALDAAASGTPGPGHGKTGSFQVAPSDKTGADFRARGRLQYVGKRYLQFAGTGEYFLKAGPDSPETLLAYADFDDTVPGRKKDGKSDRPSPNQALHRYEPHLGDWRPGDPTWRDGRGKGLIGALNYVSSKGCNTISFLPYNAGGDGDNVWPFVERHAKLHYDCSKLDQWQIVFDHALRLGLHLHFKLQEQEIDDNRRNTKSHDDTQIAQVPESLDGGDTGPERKLYCRELVARFGYELALLWNLGEENTQSTQQQRDLSQYLHDIDPYHHHIVVHTFPNTQDRVYPPLLGDQSVLTGASLQNSWNAAHQRTLKWIRESEKAGRPWVVCNDEQGPASLGVPNDPGYQGHDGVARVKRPTEQTGTNPPPSAEETRGYTIDDVRKLTLWGTLMAGGAGVEYYFGYQLPQNDLVCEDFRSRDRAWDQCRFALEFFRQAQLPLPEMSNSDELVGNSAHDNSIYCLSKPGTVYLVYLPHGGTAELDLSGASGSFEVRWFNPRTGGDVVKGSVESVNGGARVSLGSPPADEREDWLVIAKRR